jgi:hypothetical protein
LAQISATVGADLDVRAAEVVGKGVGDGQGLATASSDPKNCFGYMMERRAALFSVAWLSDGMIDDYVSERSAT